MKTKTKLSLGITFLFILILGMSGASIYFIRTLASDSGQIIKDNLISFNYVEQMNNDLDKIQYSMISGKSFEQKDTFKLLTPQWFKYFDQSIDSEASNITEPGEKEAVSKLTESYSNYKLLVQNNNADARLSRILMAYMDIKFQLAIIYDVNQKAIVRKNTQATNSATTAVFYITLIGSIFFIVAFVFILNFPGYIADPIKT